MHRLFRALGFVPVLASLFFGANAARSEDVFDRHTSFWLDTAVRQLQPVERLTSGEAHKLKPIGPGIESACVVVRTADGNIAKALVSWGLRKHNPRPEPVLLIERFVTYDGARRDMAIAHGENVMLFLGFRFDFDTGQVVPTGYGEDVCFEEGWLAPLSESKLFALDGPVIPAAEVGEYDPQASKEIRPADFNGVWRLNADGRWQGDLRLAADDDGNVFGQFTSDETKSIYQAAGKVSDGHRLRLTIQFANTDQDFDLYLRTTDKATLAGTTTLLQRTFGAVAEREKKSEK